MSYIASVRRAEKFDPSLLMMNSGLCAPSYRPDRTRTEVTSERSATDQSLIPYCHKKLPSGTVKAVSQTGIFRVMIGRNLTPLVENIKAKGKSENTDDLWITSNNQNRSTIAANVALLRTQCQYLKSRKISQNCKDAAYDAKICEKEDQKQRAITVGINGYKKVHNGIQMENPWTGRRRENHLPNPSSGDERFALNGRWQKACKSPRSMKGEINRNGNAFFTTSQWDSRDKRKESADGTQLDEDTSLQTYVSLKFCSVDDDYSISDEQEQQAGSEEGAFTDEGRFADKIEENALMRVVTEHDEDLKLMIFSPTVLDHFDLDGSRIGQYQDLQKTGRDLGHIKIRVDDELFLDTSITPPSPETVIKIDPTRNLTGNDEWLVSSDVSFPHDVKQPDRYEIDDTKTRSEDLDIRAEILTANGQISSKEEPKATKGDDNIKDAIIIATENLNKRQSEITPDRSSSSLFLGRKPRLRRPGTFLPYIKSKDYNPTPSSHCLPKFPRITLPILWGVPPELPGTSRISPYLKPAAPFSIFPPEKVMTCSYQIAAKHYSAEKDKNLKLHFF